MTERKFMTREELIATLEYSHSEEFVIMFLGFFCGDLPELRTVEPDRVLDSWKKFKVEMGKRP